MDDERRYSEAEIAKILAQASEGVPSAKDGVTLEILLQSASELGLDAGRVRQAARRLDSEMAPSESSPLWGGQFFVRCDRTVPGTFDESDWPAVVEEIRDATGYFGQSSLVGKSHEWSVPDLPMFFTLAPKAQGVQLRCVAKTGPYGWLFHWLAFVFGLLAALIVTMAFAKVMSVGWFVFPLFLLTGFMTARSAFGALTRKREKQCRTAIDRVSDFLASRSSLSTPSALAVEAEDRPPIEVRGQ